MAMEWKDPSNGDHVSLSNESLDVAAGIDIARSPRYVIYQSISIFVIYLLMIGSYYIDHKKNNSNI
jgi:hypothetical protein